MNIQPIDLPSLLRAVTLPLIAAVALYVFRRPISALVGDLGQRIQKFSFAGVFLELAQVSEMKPPQAVETGIRQLEAGIYQQSGVPAITGLVGQLQRGRHTNTSSSILVLRRSGCG
jgi:hypothetical protein